MLADSRRFQEELFEGMTFPALQKLELVLIDRRGAPQTEYLSPERDWWRGEVGVRRFMALKQSCPHLSVVRVCDTFQSSRAEV